MTPETIRAGAGYRDNSLDPLTIVRRAMSEVEIQDLRELACQFYGYPVLDEKGFPRQQSQTELIVLIVKFFGRWIDRIGLGARVFNAAPYLFGGSHWKPVGAAEFVTLLGDFALQIGCDPVQFGIFTAREKLVSQFHTVHAGQMMERPAGIVLVNFLNSTLEIGDAREAMREFRKADFLTYQLPFDYNPAATCPMFDRYLVRLLPEGSSRAVLAEFIGWLFLRDLKLEKILVLFGDGHNGKSVFFDIMNAMLGSENVTNYGLTSLAKMENRVALGSALLNFGSEISDRCDTDLLKMMASGEPIEARRLYHDAYVMRDYARLAFNANVLPRDAEHTTGFFRRFLIVPFDQTISEDEKDPQLARKIIESELSGVFNWVMAGLRRLRTQKHFTRCAAADKALADYRMESDSAAGFLEDGGWQASDEHRTGKGELYQLYQEYCRGSGHRPLNKLNFGKRLLKTHEIAESKSGSVRFWHIHRPQEP